MSRLRGRLPPAVAAVLADPAARDALSRQVQQRLDETRLQLYRPYARQAAFHEAGASFRERLLMAGNQVGKTWTAGAEAAFHLTGDYPAWWKGRRFDRPTAGWAAGVTNELTRDAAQRVLCGRAEALGTGMIPKHRIKDSSTTRGVPDALDTVFVHHASGGTSQVTFKSYQERRAKWQAETLDWVWMDEEPPADLYSEALTRTNATGGLVWTTFTPLEGMSAVVRLFYPRPATPDRFLVRMEIEDALHIDAAQRARIIASYPAHEREARTRGVPMLGGGAVFTLPESAFVVPAFAIPAHWPRLIGIDLGFDHPFAAAQLAFDRDADTAYVTHTIQAARQTIAQHAQALRPWGADIPVAWPHDAAAHDRQSATTYAELYRQHGLAMLWEHATFPDGGYGLEASVADVIDRLESGRLKVFSHLGDLLEEMRGYHRKEGRLVKEHDDVIAAMRYALMMERFAAIRRTGPNAAPIRRNLRVY
ncbi:MAG TPA: terminase family protein [Roseomonas sp.]|jgi:phage terminase large subunit-like protein